MIPTKLTREEATLLFIALNTAEAGFAPANAVAAADNLNLLHPTVSALDKGKNSYAREMKQIGKDLRSKILTADEAEDRIEKLNDELAAKQEQVIEIELHPLDLTPEELVAAKPKPGALALIRRWLSAAKK